MAPENHLQVLDLIHRTVRALNAVDYSPDQVKAIINMYTSQEISLWKIAYVAMDGDRIIGVIGAYPVVWRSVQIQGLFVDPAYIRRKVGSRLLETFESNCDEKEVIRIGVSSSLTALEFYQAHDYEVQGRVRDPVPMVTLEKQLRSGEIPLTIFQERKNPNTGLQPMQIVLILVGLVILSIVIIIL